MVKLTAEDATHGEQDPPLPLSFSLSLSLSRSLVLSLSLPHALSLLQMISKHRASKFAFDTIYIATI
jgi:hypothetical protein